MAKTSQKRHRWTQEENELLQEGLEKCGAGNWEEIRRVTGLNRTGQQIKVGESEARDG